MESGRADIGRTQVSWNPNLSGQKAQVDLNSYGQYQKKKEKKKYSLVLFVRPIYGLIFLFKWQGGNDSSQIPPEADLSLDDDVYFAKQVAAWKERDVYRNMCLFGLV